MQLPSSVYYLSASVAPVAPLGVAGSVAAGSTGDVFGLTLPEPGLAAAAVSDAVPRASPAVRHLTTMLEEVSFLPQELVEDAVRVIGDAPVVAPAPASQPSLENSSDGCCSGVRKQTDHRGGADVETGPLKAKWAEAGVNSASENASIATPFDGPPVPEVAMDERAAPMAAPRISVALDAAPVVVQAGAQQIDHDPDTSWSEKWGPADARTSVVAPRETETRTGLEPVPVIAPDTDASFAREESSALATGETWSLQRVEPVAAQSRGLAERQVGVAAPAPKPVPHELSLTRQQQDMTPGVGEVTPAGASPRAGVQDSRAPVPDASMPVIAKPAASDRAERPGQPTRMVEATGAVRQSPNLSALNVSSGAGEQTAGSSSQTKDPGVTGSDYAAKTAGADGSVGRDPVASSIRLPEPPPAPPGQSGGQLAPAPAPITGLAWGVPAPGGDHAASFTGQLAKPDAQPVGPPPATPQPPTLRDADAAARRADTGRPDAPAIVAQDPAGLALSGAESALRATPTRADAPPFPTAPDVARGVAVQIAETVHRAGDRSVELTLRPEELGRVRISMHSENGTLAVTLQADRPETLDMIRRHIDMFAEELRRLGHGSVGFSFQHGAPGSGGQQPRAAGALLADDDPAHETDRPAAPVGTVAPRPHAPAAGVDIRL